MLCVEFVLHGRVGEATGVRFERSSEPGFLKGLPWTTEVVPLGLGNPLKPKP